MSKSICKCPQRVLLPSLRLFAMGGQVDSTVVHSSIALLQERFRQLERAKEMRQEKELLKMLSESKHVRAATSHVPYLLTLQPGEPLEFTLHSEAGIQSKQTQVQAAQRPIVEMTKFDDSDVDTSLHL